MEGYNCLKAQRILGHCMHMIHINVPTYVCMHTHTYTYKNTTCACMHVHTNTGTHKHTLRLENEKALQKT